MSPQENWSCSRHCQSLWVVFITASRLCVLDKTKECEENPAFKLLQLCAFLKHGPRGHCMFVCFCHLLRFCCFPSLNPPWISFCPSLARLLSGSSSVPIFVSSHLDFGFMDLLLTCPISSDNSQNSLMIYPNDSSRLAFLRILPQAMSSG